MMLHLPRLRQLKKEEILTSYAKNYLACSGLPVHQQYLTKTANRVFGIFLKHQLIGGFILGGGPVFRSIEYFVHPYRQPEIYTRLGELSGYTEICCFWICPKYRRKTWLNTFTWLAMMYAMRVYGARYLLFASCSKSLARLYAQTPRSILFHQDSINGKATYVFHAQRKDCITGMLELISYKLKRVFNIKCERARLAVQRIES